MLDVQVDNETLFIRREGVDVAIVNLFDHGSELTIDVIPTAGRPMRAMMFTFRRGVVHGDDGGRHWIEYGDVTDEADDEPRLHGSPVAVIIGEPAGGRASESV